MNRMLNTEQDPDVSSWADDCTLRKGRKKQRLMTSLREEESSCMPFNYEARKREQRETNDITGGPGKRRC